MKRIRRWNNLEKIKTILQHKSSVNLKFYEEQEVTETERNVIKNCTLDSAPEIMRTETWKTETEWWDDEREKATGEKNKAKENCLQGRIRRSLEQYTLKREKTSLICRKKIKL